MGYDLHHGNAFQVLEEEYDENSIDAVVTDPPYGVVEFETANVEKMREGKGGVSLPNWMGINGSRYPGSRSYPIVIRRLY